MEGLSPESSTSCSHGDGVDSGGAQEHDRLLPTVGIGRIMRQAFPENVKISREAKDFMQECVTEYISFVTTEGTTKDFVHLINLQRRIVLLMLETGVVV
ncbi:hypothetical protein M5K25_026010 [Dendrobium thyrsiflorum]|uniref:Transcription factor CBF/NF-Y/archaeal histone domain-containing protein n=1 Tax=Dendrobium thyrsiflorum TaxID=117978 RepID=A0ABD0TW95_DENTH